MGYCPNCGKSVQDHMNYCSACGSKLQTKKLAESAGSYQLPQNAAFRQPVSPKMTGTYPNHQGNFRAPGSFVTGMQYRTNTAHSDYVRSNPAPQRRVSPVNCPNCGALVDSMSSRCRSCGTELYYKAQASACRELCNRLDQIEASRPKETLISFVAGLANTALNKNKIPPTDQQKIELIGNFIIPNTKTDIMEFLFLAKTRIEACRKFTSSSDENVAVVQQELLHVWESKYEQTLEKAKIVLSDDPDFRAFYIKQQRASYRNEHRCQYCGGHFRGIVNRVCSRCGKPKDY